MAGGATLPRTMCPATSCTRRSAGCRWKSSGSKKKLPSSSAELRRLVDPEHAALSIRRQCELLGLHRSSWYYEPVAESTANLRLMRLLDEQYLKTPFYGSRRLAVALQRQGYQVNRKRVQRLLRQMGLEAIYPKPRTTRRGPEARIYPYLLRDLTITRPNQVWAADITYVPLRQGFLYLVAILDWFSRYVIAWRLSNALEGSFCWECLDEALARTRPEIFNTDQGVQFTSEAFTGRLLANSIAISMDGRGRALDNVFVERLWRTVKYEEVYLKDYTTAWEAERSLADYFWFYDHERVHSSLAYQTPAELYFPGSGKRPPRRVTGLCQSPWKESAVT
jgi:putative transposase